MDTDWQTLMTVVPTALSASLYSMTRLTFEAAMARRRAARDLPVMPWVSILKPIAGVDDDLRENLESFVDLDYPAYEILFGIAQPDDPGVPVVRAFLAAHPGLSAQLVFTSPPRGRVMNPKVAQLIGLARRARGSVLVVSDAGVRVPRSYLRSMVAVLLRPGVGLVSSVIAGVGERTLAAAIDNAQLGVFVAPSVVTAHRLGLWPITVGKSMAMRRADLERVGGFEGVADVLAEDDVLGRRFDAMGYSVELCLDPIESHSVRGSWSRTLDRHARWAKMRRAITPAGFFLELLLSPLMVAAAVFLLLPSALSLRMLVFSLVLTWGGAFLSLRRLRGRGALVLAALEPLRAAMMLWCWGVACMSRRVVWRGNAFSLGRGSTLYPGIKQGLGIGASVDDGDAGPQRGGHDDARGGLLRRVERARAGGARRERGNRSGGDVSGSYVCGGDVSSGVVGEPGK